MRRWIRFPAHIFYEIIYNIILIMKQLSYNILVKQETLGKSGALLYHRTICDPDLSPLTLQF
jgi:hypothetical protein